MDDRTHWFGCWKYHHGCALARIEQLERALAEIACIVTLADKKILGTDNRGRILGIIDSMKEKK